MAAYGARIAEVLRPGDVVALSGGLGAGKTTLARAILAGLGHEGEVPSPTFSIIERTCWIAFEFPSSDPRCELSISIRRRSDWFSRRS